MVHTRNYLALDLGASGGRAIIGRFDGERLALEEVHRFPNGPVCLPGAGGATCTRTPRGCSSRSRRA